MNAETFNHYCDLMDAKRDLEAKIETLKPELMAEMDKAGKDEVAVGDRGVITIALRRTYKYPPSVVKIEESLKQAKVEAEAKGEATATETRYPVFKAKKGD